MVSFTVFGNTHIILAGSVEGFQYSVSEQKLQTGTLHIHTHMITYKCTLGEWSAFSKWSEPTNEPISKCQCTHKIGTITLQYSAGHLE